MASTKKHLVVLRGERASQWERTQLFAEEYEDPTPLRPKTRGDCVDGLRPCPFVSCRHHLYIDVSEKTGNIRFNFPGRELEELPATCSLDVADMGEHDRVIIGKLTNNTREGARQIETRALLKLIASGAFGDYGDTSHASDELREHLPERYADSPSIRRLHERITKKSKR